MHGRRNPSLAWRIWDAQPPPVPFRLLADAVVHFPPMLAEVTLGTGPGGKISLRNYVEDEAGESCRVRGPLPTLGCPPAPHPCSFPLQSRARPW